MGPLPGVNEDALSHPQAGEGAEGWRGAAGREEEGSCVCARTRVCICALEGRGREQGAKTGGRPSEEKAAIVKAGQLHRGPRGGGPGRI